MGLRNIRQRRFRGLCVSAPLWPEVFATFNQRRSDIEGLFRNQEGLDENVLEKSLDYIDDFFEVINDDGKVRRELERYCLDT